MVFLATRWLFYSSVICILMLWSFGKYWFAKFCESSKYWHTMKYEMQYKKFTFVNITSSHVQNIFKFGQAVKLMVIDAGFPKVLILTWVLNFYYRQQILSVVFLKVTHSLCSCLRKCLPKTQAWITVISHSFFAVNMVLHAANSSSACSSHDSAGAFAGAPLCFRS